MPIQTNFKIEGINCAACVAKVEAQLNTIPNVKSAALNYTDGNAQITSLGAVNLRAIQQNLDAIGYSLATETLDFQVSGISCASCIERIEQSMKSTQGVVDIDVNPATRIARVDFIPTTQTVDGLLRAFAQLDYPARLLDEHHDTAPAVNRTETQNLAMATIAAMLFTLPIFAIEMGGHIYAPIHHWTVENIGTQNSRLFQFLLCSILIFGPGRSFFTIGLKRLATGAPDMNSLIAMGAGAAYVLSVFATLFGSNMPKGMNNIYFEAAAMIITLILLGRYLEARAKGATGVAVQKLFSLSPKTATVERQGETTRIPINEIIVGDIVHLQPGEKVAVDSQVISGSSVIDESMLTGEAMPLVKQCGDAVFAGTVNGGGHLTMRAAKVGADTALAQIIQLVTQAQNTKLPIQRKVDWVAARFVPAVIAMAIATACVWLLLGGVPAAGHAFVAAISVLVIACPCAMGLATPTSIIVGMGRAAQLGVLFRKGEALEQLQGVNIIAFDKTGTLTQGIPELVDFAVFGEHQIDTLLPLLAAAEARSEHPLAQAIIRAAEPYEAPEFTVEGFDAKTGYGVSARIDGRFVQIGTRRMMAEHSIDITPALEKFKTYTQEGKTSFLAAVDGEIAAVFAVADQLRPEAEIVIHTLHNAGIQTALISGDNERAARAIAGQLQIGQVFSEMLPSEKLEAIERLRENGARVGYVGDGINDAPALAAADIGFAIGSGTDTALEAADIILSASDLTGVLNALKISKNTLRNIWQNLFWAFGYNVLLIPIAAGALYPINGTLLSPAMAAGAMALSSVLVVLNALRLRFLQTAYVATEELK